MLVKSRKVELCVKNSAARVDIKVCDDAGAAITPSSLHLRIFNSAESLLVEDDLAAGVTIPTTAVGPTRIQTPALGTYYYNFGGYGTESACAGTYVFHWTVTAASGTESQSVIQVVRVVSVRTLARLVDVRHYVDKTVKNVSDDPDDLYYLGFTDPMLIGYMEGGLSLINAYQPYPVWSTLDDFPDDHRVILWEATLLVTLDAQEGFAIDNDMNYNDYGEAFLFDHAPKLAALAARITQRLDRLVPDVKKMYVDTGGIRLEMGSNYRLAHLLAAAPNGSLFRSMFMAG